MNTIDVDKEFIAREYARIRIEHDATLTEAEKREAQASELAANESDTTASDTMTADTRDVLVKWVNAGLDAFLNNFLNLNVEVALFESFAEATADMLQKHNARLSAIQIIEKYKVEIAFGWALMMLSRAVIAGMKEKRALAAQGVVIENGGDDAAAA